MTTILPYKTITKIPDTEPDAVPDLWNTTYEEIDENLKTLANEEHFSVCETEASRAEKIAPKDNFEIGEGAHVTVLFRETNSAESPTLNVGSTGEFPIRYMGATVAAGALRKGCIFEFRFADQAWNLCGSIDLASIGDINLKGGLSAENGNFRGNVTGKDPVEDDHLATKRYVDLGDAYGKGIFLAVDEFNKENGIV